MRRGRERARRSVGPDVGAAHAQCEGCGSPANRRTSPVGSFRPNGFGLYDTAGNAAEWVEDCWSDNYRNAPKDASAATNGDCHLRVLRGGNFTSKPADVRSAARFRYDSDVRYYANGFRSPGTCNDAHRADRHDGRCVITRQPMPSRMVRAGRSDICRSGSSRRASPRPCRAAESNIPARSTLRHVGLCSVNGVEEKSGKLRLTMSRAPGAAEGTLAMEGDSCRITATQAPSYSGLLTCRNGQGVPISFSIEEATGKMGSGQRRQDGGKHG